MATEVKLPRLGQGMESGVVVRWLKQEGDKVEKGDPLYELDTEKVTQEVEAEASGVLLKIAVSEGEVPVGQTVAVIGDEGEEVAETEVEAKPADEPGSEAEEPQSDETEVDETPQEEGSRGPARDEEREEGKEASGRRMGEQITQIREPQSDGRVKASPLARRIARERGIDLAQVHGTGPEGRVVAEDVERSEVAPGKAKPADAPATAPSAEVQVEPLTPIRKTIARRLTEAWQAPVFQISMSADMTRVLELRAKLVELAGEGPKPTISDVLTKVSASSLMRHRSLNAEFVGEEVRIHPTANVGMAVATDRGLVVPVTRGADRLSIQEIAAQRVALVLSLIHI